MTGEAARRSSRDPRAEAALDDGLQRRWTPDRMAYILGEGKPATSEPGNQCPFCRAATLDDESGLIVARGMRVYAVLNLYPYNTGHLLLCTYRHVAEYTELDSEETAELAVFAQRAMTALRAGMAPDGFNLGMNQGPIAGAGIAAHLHQHVVPRWTGDANFIPIIGRTKVLPQDLPVTRDLIARNWPSG